MRHQSSLYFRVLSLSLLFLFARVVMRTYEYFDFVPSLMEHFLRIKTGCYCDWDARSLGLNHAISAIVCHLIFDRISTMCHSKSWEGPLSHFGKRFIFALGLSIFCTCYSFHSLRKNWTLGTPNGRLQFLWRRGLVQFVDLTFAYPCSELRESQFRIIAEEHADWIETWFQCGANFDFPISSFHRKKARTKTDLFSTISLDNWSPSEFGAVHRFLICIWIFVGRASSAPNVKTEQIWNHCDKLPLPNFLFMQGWHKKTHFSFIDQLVLWFIELPAC